MQGYNGARAAIEHASRRVVQGRLCITSRSNGSDRRREQRRLCIATAAQRQRPSMHRDSESNADCGEAMATTEHPASDQRDGEHGRLCFATTKQRQRPSIDRDGESSADYARIQRSIGSSDRASSRQRAQRRVCGAMAGRRVCGATAATEHASRREQGRLCIATAKQRQRHIMHYDGESSVG